MEDTPEMEPELSDSDVKAMEQRYWDVLNDRKLLAIHEAGHAAYWMRST